MTAIWLGLFPTSFHGMQASSSAKAVARSVEVPVDGLGSHRFVARFPFSFYINRVLEPMRINVATQKANRAAAFLQQQFELLRLPADVDKPLPATLLQAYCHDMVCMNTAFSLHVDRTLQTNLVWRLLVLTGATWDAASKQVQINSPTLLSSMHARYWGVEKRVHAYNLLLEAVPTAQPAVLAVIDKATGVSGALDCAIVRVLLETQLERLVSLTKAEDYVPWLQSLKRMLPTVHTLLAAAAADPSPVLIAEPVVKSEPSDEKSAELDDEKGQSDDALSADRRVALVAAIATVPAATLESLHLFTQRVEFLSRCVYW